MAFIDWNEDLSVENDDIDAQHQVLVGMVNKIYDNIGNSGSPEIEQVINELLEYTAYHFEAEEKHMADMGYPDLEKHKELHRRLVKRAVEIKDIYDRNPRQGTPLLVKFLRDWLVNHILGKDMDYAEFETGKKRSAWKIIRKLLTLGFK